MRDEKREIPKLPDLFFAFSFAGLLFFQPFQGFFGSDDIGDVPEGRGADQLFL